MKVAFIVTKIVNKGPILVVKDLVTGLSQRGVDCTVLHFDAEKEIEMPCEVRRISFWKGVDFSEYDVIHSHGLRPDAYVWLHRSKMGKAKCLSTMHNYMRDDLAYQYNKVVSLIFSRLWLFVLKRHDLIVALSKHAMVYYGRWFSKDKLAYVYNAKTVNKDLTLNEDELEELRPLKRKYKVIGVNALLTERKGVDQLIDVLCELPDYALVIIGDGQERKKLEQRAERRGVKERCLFLGYRLNAFRYLAHYDIYGMVSRSEGFPLSLIEAAAYGVPTVCSRIPIFEETFTNEEVAFFALDNVDSLKKAIQRLETDNVIGVRFHQAYEERYTLDKMVTNYMRLYEKGTIS